MADFSASCFDLPSCGFQPEGLKSSAPKWGLGTSSREQFRKVYLSDSHSQDVLGCDSPGPMYNSMESSKNIKPVKCYRFAKAARASFKDQYPPTSNDLLQKEMPDCTSYKHYHPGQTKFGSALRTAPVNAPGFTGFAPGKISPGPAHYSANFFSANKQPPAFSIASKVKGGGASKYEVRPSPAEYTQCPALGKQSSGRKPSRPIFSFGKAPRFPQKKLVVKIDAMPAGDDTGDLRLKYQRSFSQPPSWKMGTSTRDKRQRMAMCMCKEDAVKIKSGGAGIGEPRIPSNIPTRRDWIKLTDRLSDIR